MSVVVRMEMPEDCFECPFGIIDDTEGGVWCNALAQPSSGQREDCPIICSLPEGHGELVDRKAVYEKIKRWQEAGADIFTVSMLHEFYVMLFTVPVIVPAERRANDGTD